MKIGLTLSGGGFRATVFHLGVLGRLADDNLLENITFISTVSGGSLCAGLVYAKSELHWSSSSHFIESIVPDAFKLLTTHNLQRTFIRRAFLSRLLTSPWNFFRSRAEDLAVLLQEKWGIKGSLRELPDLDDPFQPRWIINTTCHESGKNWQFSMKRMGDYELNYVLSPDYPISYALAASAGFPGAIGPLVFNTTPWEWVKYSNDQKTTTTVSPPEFNQVHLWDGGIYDNLGTEPLTGYSKDGSFEYRQNVDYLIICDGCGRPERGGWSAEWKFWKIPGRYLRLYSIAADQVRSLRARAIVGNLIARKAISQGQYIQIGRTCQEILKNVGTSDADIQKVCSECLPEKRAKELSQFPTTLERLSRQDFEDLFRHGYEVTDLTLNAYEPDKFNRLGYARQKWGF